MVKKILVFGATGKQGCSVLCSLSDKARENDWKLYGCCRHTKTECSQKLSEVGVELIQADLSDENSLRNALKGIDIVYLVTDSWDESQSGDNEYKLGTRAARLAKDAGVSHIIFSSLPNVEKISKGKYNVPQFTNKARIEDDIRGMGFKHTTFVELGHYFNNWFSFLKRVEGDTINLVLPTKNQFANVDVTRLLGPTVLYCIQNPDKVNGKNIFIQNQMISGEEFAKSASKVLDRKVHFKTVGLDEFKKGEGMKNAKTLGDMYGFIDEFGLFGPRDIVSKGMMATDFLDSKLVLNVDQWLEREKETIRRQIEA
jgi:uncharacterized protein YbjT (DUF2867 family)